MSTKYYEVSVNMTGKAIGSKGDYSGFGHERKEFGTIAEVKTYLKERYADCKRTKMFVDDSEGNAKHIGYIYCFKNADWSHSPVEHWYQQDWVQVREIVATPVIV